MLCANRRNRELSRTLRVLVHQGIDERVKRTARPGINNESNQGTVSKQLENFGKELEILPVQNEHCGQKCNEMLDTRQSEALASRILAGLQDHAKASFQRSACDGQRCGIAHRCDSIYD